MSKIGWILLLGLIPLSYIYWDQPLVWFLHDHNSRRLLILKQCANTLPILIDSLVFIFYCCFALQSFSSKKIKHFKKYLFVCNVIAITTFLKDSLKFIFGRYWPDTFICNNPSLIENHMYGFQWFDGGSTSLSFPSGHAALMFAFATSMTLMFPRFRSLWFFMAILVSFCQIGLYYHYLSDVIAGALLGYTVAYCSYRTERLTYSPGQMT